MGDANEVPKYSGVGREELLRIIKVQAETIGLLRIEVANLKTQKVSGIHLNGWWCNQPQASGMSCDTFNGQEKEEHIVCRNCGANKPVQVYQPR